MAGLLSGRPVVPARTGRFAVFSRLDSLRQRDGHGRGDREDSRRQSQLEMPAASAIGLRLQGRRPLVVKEEQQPSALRRSHDSRREM